MRRAIYAGSFDPPTNGHVWMIEQGAKLFDELIVGVGVNPAKQYTFITEQRLDLLRCCVGHLDNVKVSEFGIDFLVDFAAEQQADYILRGIRTNTDFEMERTMRHVNGDFAADITSVFLIPPRELIDISSSFVKNMVGPKNWPARVAPYVPAAVLQTFKTMEEQ